MLQNVESSEAAASFWDLLFLRSLRFSSLAEQPVLTVTSQQRTRCWLGSRRPLSLIRDPSQLVHVSVPTILGESQEQYDAIQSYGANTIDNEISYMAAAVRAGRRFSACHFITDHLHSAEELELMKGDPRVRYDLAIMAQRTPESQQLAERAKYRVVETVCHHLRSWAPLQTDSTAILGCWRKYSDVDWAPYINIVQKRLVINVSYLKSWTRNNFEQLKAMFGRNVEVELYLPDPRNPPIMAQLKQRFWYKGDTFDGPANIAETVNLLKWQSH